MAKHVAQGREFPIFFYGQHYAFSSVEAADWRTGLPRLAASGAMPLKLSMLALWTLGVVFLFLALSRLLGAARSFWITAILVLNPTWAVWSMKAGGGYLTSFTATAVLLWLIARERDRDTDRSMAHRRRADVDHLSRAAALVARRAADCGRWFSRRVAARRGESAISSWRRQRYFSSSWQRRLAPIRWGGPTLGNPDLARIAVACRAADLRESDRIVLPAMGDRPAGPATTVLAVVWCVVLPAAVLMQVYRLLHQTVLPAVAPAVRCRCVRRSSPNGCCSACATRRYLLPLGGLLVLLAGVELADLVDRRLVAEETAVALTLAAAAARLAVDARVPRVRLPVEEPAEQLDRGQETAAGARLPEGQRRHGACSR